MVFNLMDEYPQASQHLSVTALVRRPQCIVVILGHLGANEQQMDKYAEVYHDHLCSTVCATAPSLSLASNDTVTMGEVGIAAIREAARLIRMGEMSEMGFGRIPCICHVLGNGGAQVLEEMERRIREVLDDASNNHKKNSNFFVNPMVDVNAIRIMHGKSMRNLNVSQQSLLSTSDSDEEKKTEHDHPKHKTNETARRRRSTTPTAKKNLIPPKSPTSPTTSATFSPSSKLTISTLKTATANSLASPRRLSLRQDQSLIDATNSFGAYSPSSERGLLKEYVASNQFKNEQQQQPTQIDDVPQTSSILCSYSSSDKSQSIEHNNKSNASIDSGVVQTTPQPHCVKPLSPSSQKDISVLSRRCSWYDIMLPQCGPLDSQCRIHSPMECVTSISPLDRHNARRRRRRRILRIPKVQRKDMERSKTSRETPVYNLEDRAYQLDIKLFASRLESGAIVFDSGPYFPSIQRELDAANHLVQNAASRIVTTSTLTGWHRMSHYFPFTTTTSPSNTKKTASPTSTEQVDSPSSSSPGRPAQFWQNMQQLQLSKRHGFIFSRTDNVCPHNELEQLMEIHKSRGIQVLECEMKRTQHLSHRMERSFLYSEFLEQIINSIGGRKIFGIQDQEGWWSSSSEDEGDEKGQEVLVQDTFHFDNSGRGDGDGDDVVCSVEVDNVDKVIVGEELKLW